MVFIKSYYEVREYLKRIYLAFRKIKKRKFPKTISIELNCLCNADCSFCPQKKLKRNPYMEDRLFHKIIDELVGKKVERILPYMLGEPFLNKKIFYYLEHIRKKLPFTKIEIITNAELLIPKKSEYLLKNNLVDNIRFSINGFYPNTIKKIMKINPEKAIKNVLEFQKINKRSKNIVPTAVSFVLCRDNYKEWRKFKKFWRGKVDNIVFHSDDGKWSGVPFIKNRATKYPCKAIFKEFHVLSSGKVMFCCMDPFCRFPMGDINKQTISEIWNGEKYHTLWNQHLKYKKYLNPVCRNCRVTY